MISSKIKKIFNIFLISILIVCILLGINVIYQLGIKSFMGALFSAIAAILFYSLSFIPFNFDKENKKLKSNLKEDLFNKKFYYIKKRCLILFIMYFIIILVFFLLLLPKTAFTISIVGVFSFFQWTLDCLCHYKQIFSEIKNEKEYRKIKNYTTVAT